MEKKLLFVQVRRDQEALDQEFNCLIKQSGLLPQDIIRHNLVSSPLRSENRNYSGLVIGGSGDFSGQDDYPNRNTLEDLIRQAENEKWPILGICFGAQVIAQALGGKAIEDRSKAEIGTCLLRLLPEAINDILFADFPTEFLANEGHHSYVSELPPGAVNLAESDICPVQAFRSAGGHIYAFQFHPELDREAVLWRLRHYNSQYSSNDSPEFKIEDTPEASRLLRIWLNREVLK